MSREWPPFAAAGERVRLRELTREGDSVAGEVIRLSDGARAGEFRLAVAERSLFVERLCIDDGKRGYGLGSEAAQLLRDSAARAGFARLEAWAHPDLGLSVYFWIRMGLRPRFGADETGGVRLWRDLVLTA